MLVAGGSTSGNGGGGGCRCGGGGGSEESSVPSLTITGEIVSSPEGTAPLAFTPVAPILLLPFSF